MSLDSVEYALGCEVGVCSSGGHGSPGNFAFPRSDDADEVVWHGGNSGMRTHEVGMLRPNALGLYDMGGNVWVWDWFGTYPSVAETDPTGVPIQLNFTAVP